MSADIGVFHLLTNQEGNLSSAHMCVYWLRRGRDVVTSLVPYDAHPPPNISDMLNLEFRAPKILDSVECCLGVFHPLCEGAEQGTDIGDIGPKRCRR